MAINYPDITVNQSDEFFLAIGQNDVHSYMMLGTINPDGRARLLARFGKVFRADPDSDNRCKILMKLACDGTSATLDSELAVGRTKKDKIKQIRYKAYSINYDQVVDYLHLVAFIEKQSNLAASKAIRLRDGAYYPQKNTDSTITFQYKNLIYSTRLKESDHYPELAISTQSLTKSNTCRHTSIEMMETVLKFRPNVSDFFMIRPEYQTTLRGGELDSKRFYALPVPPTAFNNLSEKQQRVAKKLYQRLEAIPELKSESKASWKKFNSLKKLYVDIVGQNQLNADDLLKNICEHEQKNANTLYQQRNCNPLIKLGLFSTSTERLINGIKTELEKESGILLPVVLE